MGGRAEPSQRRTSTLEQGPKASQLPCSRAKSRAKSRGRPAYDMLHWRQWRVNKVITQLINEPVNKPINPLTNQSTNKINVSTNQSNQCINQPIKLTNQPANQPANQPINQSKAIYQPITQSNYKILVVSQRTHNTNTTHTRGIAETLPCPTPRQQPQSKQKTRKRTKHF